MQEAHSNQISYINIMQDNKAYLSQLVLGEKFRIHNPMGLAVPLTCVMLDSSYYKLEAIEIKNKKANIMFIEITKVSDYVLKANRAVYSIKSNRKENTSSVELEIELYSMIQGPTKVKLTGNDRKTIGDFRAKINQYGVFSDNLKTNDLMTLISHCCNSGKIPTTYSYNQIGLIVDKNIWVMSNGYIDLKTKELFLDKNTHIVDDEIEETLNLPTRQDKTAQEIASKLLNYMHITYKSRLAVLFALGISILSPFSTFFKQKINVYPTLYIWGNVDGGKSSFLELVAYFVGGDKTFIKSGASTIAAQWALADQYSGIPLIIDESRQNETTDSFIKDIFGVSPRALKNSQKVKLQTTFSNLILCSNFPLAARQDVVDKMYSCLFDSKDLNTSEMDDFKEIKENYLSTLLVEVLKIDNEKVWDLYQKSLDRITKLSENPLSKRESKVFAIGLAGIQLLYHIAGLELPTSISDKLGSFLIEYKSLNKPESALDQFLDIIPYLIDTHYHLTYKNYIEVKNQTLKIYFSEVYPYFPAVYNKVYRGRTAPSLKEILAVASWDKRVIKGSNQTTKNLRIGSSKKPVKGLEIDISQHENLMYLNDVNPQDLSSHKGT